jgi:hypothetical protein
MIPNSLRLPTVVLILALPGCGSGDLLLPGGPAGLTRVSGDGQSGPTGSLLPDPLVVEVTDAEGRRVMGTVVEFTFASSVPDGAVTPETATTDGQGRASAEVQLGTVEGDQPVEARVAADSALRARFSLTALARGGGGGGNGGNGGNGGGGGGGGSGGGGDDGGGDGGGDQRHGHGKGHGKGHGG